MDESATEKSTAPTYFPMGGEPGSQARKTIPPIPISMPARNSRIQTAARCFQNITLSSFCSKLGRSIAQESGQCKRFAPERRKKRAAAKESAGLFFPLWGRYRPVLLKNEKMKFVKTCFLEILSMKFVLTFHRQEL